MGRAQLPSMRTRAKRGGGDVSVSVRLYGLTTEYEWQDDRDFGVRIGIDPNCGARMTFFSKETGVAFWARRS